MIERMNVTSRPCLKGAEMRLGKNVLPVSAAAFAAGRALRTLAGISCCIGLKPRNAAKRLETGGADATCCAIAEGMPCAVRPLKIAVGSEDERPTIIRLKKMPIESTWPEFIKV